MAFSKESYKLRRYERRRLAGLCAKCAKPNDRRPQSDFCSLCEARVQKHAAAAMKATQREELLVRWFSVESEKEYYLIDVDLFDGTKIKLMATGSAIFGLAKSLSAAVERNSQARELLQQQQAKILELKKA